MCINLENNNINDKKNHSYLGDHKNQVGTANRAQKKCNMVGYDQN